MKRLRHLFLFAALLATTFSWGQGVQHPQYVIRESTTQTFPTQYAAWVPGTALYSGDAADDEEFFISRVKPKVRFMNQATQVNTALDGKRRMLWWCPIGESSWNAIPTYFFNSEVFSMWSYLDHYGNWTASLIRQPAAFTDVCHKNGVINSVVATTPFSASIGATTEPHGTTMNALANGGADKFLKFLRYYGVDGVGYNSEFVFSDATLKTNLNTLFVNAFKKKDAAGVPNFSMAWYSLTNNAGTISGSDWNSLNSGNQNWFNNGGTVANNFFLNYNWNSSLLSSSQTLANSFAGRSSYDVFAGMDFQGRSSADWLALNNYNISIGFWGAHNMNMLYESRGEQGSDAVKQQGIYQTKSELVFTGGTRNPVNTPAISNFLGYGSTSTQFHGISKFLNARSTLQSTDISKEPFVSYFNLGNGKFFNYKGITTFPNEWYNIGMQDYLPSWRWWLTSTFLGRTATVVPATGITAAFTWEDAWFGGSCLKVKGQTATEYLHLFKTKYPLLAGDQVTVRYKLQQGAGEFRLACSADGSESVEALARVLRNTEVPSGQWTEKVILIGARTGELNLAGKTLAMIALKFENTSADFSLLVGEVSVKRSAAVAPVKPVITKSKLLATNFKGVDFKLTYKMKDIDPANPAVPIYNEDVNTWYYKIYSQQMNEEPTLCTTTTSWAAYVVSAPFKADADKNIRFGVSAVGFDGISESAITWTDYAVTGNAAVVEGIEIDKPVIKANEIFTVRYKDPNHDAAKKWEILNAQTGASVQVIENEQQISTVLPTVGIYDLSLTANILKNNVPYDSTFIYRGLIQISGNEVGALPEVEELTANSGTTTINATAPAQVTYSYVGRAANGTVSRAIRIPEKPFAIKANQLGLSDQTPFSICFWFKPEKFTHGDSGTQLLNIRATDDVWPASDWGYVWSDIGTNNIYSLSVRRTSNAGTQFTASNFVFLPGQWTHIAFVVDWQAGRKILLYANGKKIGESALITDLYAFKQTNIIMIGGVAAFRAGLNGWLDEFQFYKKALTASEVLNSMKHQNTPPTGLTGYWDFETNADANNKLFSTGTDKLVYAGIQDFSASAALQPTSFGPGVPFIQGTNYNITTTTDWKLDGAEVTTAASGNDAAGNVSVKYLNNGIYRATVTLTNGWGSSAKTFEFVKVGGSYKVDYSILPTNIHPNNVQLYYANVGSSTFEPVVSGQSYPDGSTLRLIAKPITLDGVSMFQKWIINGTDNLSASTDIVLTADQIISANFAPYTGTHNVINNANFKASPNPFVNEVYVQFVKAGKFNIDVLNINGQVVATQEASAQVGEFVKIGVAGSNGMYLINIKEDGKLIKVLKVLKK